MVKRSPGVFTGSDYPTIAEREGGGRYRNYGASQLTIAAQEFRNRRS